MFDLPTFYSSKMVTAKKTHKCIECYGPIFPKEVYEKCTGKWDGEIESFKVCQGCLDIFADFDGIFDEGFEFGERLTQCLEYANNPEERFRIQQHIITRKRQSKNLKTLSLN
jgi:hypothetical protein